jgi:predicted AlkP superfamily phosphohydrolase/phosphomutase
MSGGSRRMVMIGLDSMEISLVEKGVSEGWLPNIRELMTRGSSLRLSPPVKGFPGATWPTTITGTVVSDHLVLFDKRLRSGTYECFDVHADESLRPPFWRFISDAGLRSTISSIYGAGLISPFNGTQVVGWGTFDPYTSKLTGAVSDPPEVLDLLRRQFPKRHSGFLPALPRSPHDMRFYRRHVLKQAGYQARALAMLIERDDWDFFFGAIPEPHEAGHLAWALDDPAAPEHTGNPSLRGTIKAVYEAVDEGVGLILESCPSDAVIAIMTPHGMGPHHRGHQATDRILAAGGWYHKEGLDPVAPSVGGLASTVKRLTPVELRWLIGRYRSRRRWEIPSPFIGVDWARTAAFPLPSDAVSYVRVNLEGREPAGIVGPDDRDALRHEIADRVRELTDVDTGRRVVRDVHDTEDLIRRDLPDGFPDVVFEWEEEFPQAMSSSRLGTIRVPQNDPRTGDHLLEGFMVLRGPGIPSTNVASFGTRRGTLVDVAPTVLSVLGVPKPESLPGVAVDVGG